LESDVVVVEQRPIVERLAPAWYPEQSKLVEAVDPVRVLMYIFKKVTNELAAVVSVVEAVLYTM